MLRRVGSGLVGLSGLDLILPDDEVYGGPAEESFTVDGEYSNGGFSVSYSKPGGSEEFNIRLSRGRKTSLSGSRPCVGLGGRFDNYRVRAHPREGEMRLKFGVGTKHGGFDITDNMYEVNITLWNGQLCLEKPSGWTLSRLTMEGDGVVRSGSNRLIVDGKEISTNVNLGKYKGSTPMYITILGADTAFEFLKNGNMRAHKRIDFPLPGEKRGR